MNLQGDGIPILSEILLVEQSSEPSAYGAMAQESPVEAVLELVILEMELLAAQLHRKLQLNRFRHVYDTIFASRGWFTSRENC